MKKIISTIVLLALYAQADIMISAGGFDVRKKSESCYTFRCEKKFHPNANITEVLQKKSPHVNSVTIWITRNWQEDWFDAKTVQEEIINKGFTPVFIFYRFADDITPRYVQAHEKKYFEVLKKFTKYLKKLKGQKIVVLNPEYNMSGTESWDGMNDIFLKSYKILREDPQVLAGPCVGDFGNYAKTNEPQEWKLFDNSIKRAAKKADFIAFQEMRALTRNSKGDIIRTASRAYHFALYLHKKYKKPTMLAYTALSSYGNKGEEIQAEAYKSFVKYLPKMHEEADMLLFGIFHYFDYPGHVGYFNEAEEYFGVLRKDGSAKPSFTYFNQLK
jgi:hypothetical protein